MHVDGDATPEGLRDSFARELRNVLAQFHPFILLLTRFGFIDPIEDASNKEALQAKAKEVGRYLQLFSELFIDVSFALRMQIEKEKEESNEPERNAIHRSPRRN